MIKIGSPLVYLPVVDSTNLYARRLLSDNAAEGAVVLAEEQTAGRGQRGAAWHTAPGQNLTFSVLLRPYFLPAAQSFALNQAVALAVLEAARQLAPLQTFSLKWPNDLLAGNKKMAGILIETQISGHNIDAAIVGVGFNVNQTEFEGQFARQPTSLALLSGRRWDKMEEVAPVLFNRLEYYYALLKSSQTALLQTLYRNNLYLYNQWSPYRADGQVFEGKILGVTGEGFLKMENSDGQVRNFDLKEVEFLA